MKSSENEKGARSPIDGILGESPVQSKNMTSSSDKLVQIVGALLLLLVLANALVYGLHTIADFDSGWHLATGRYVLQHHQLPSTDVLSYTSAGKPWIYPPFAGVLFYLIYAAWGYAGLSWFVALSCLAVTGYLVRRNQLASTILAALAVPVIAVRMSPRADLFSIMLFAFFFGQLWAYQRGARVHLWPLPVLMFFWVNLHPGFIAGLGAILAYLCMETSDILFLELKPGMLRLGQVWPWLAASVAATLLNPSGVKVYQFAYGLAGLQKPPSTAEFNNGLYIAELLGTPITGSSLMRLIHLRHPESVFWWLLIIAALLIVLALWKRRVGAALLLAGAIFISMQHLRYRPFFCIVTVIVGGALIEDALASARRKGETATKVGASYRLAGTILAAIMGVLSLLQIGDSVTNRRSVIYSDLSSFGAGESWWFPERAAAFIERERLPGAIFEGYALGGFMALRLGPTYPEFLDGRGVDPSIFVEERALMAAQADSATWRAEAERRNINVLVLSLQDPEALDADRLYSFCESATWRPVYLDETSAVFLRNVGENARWLDRLQISCRTHPFNPPESASRVELFRFYSNVGSLLFVLGRYQESEAALHRASSLFPDDPNVHLALAELYEHQQNPAVAEQEFRAAIQRSETERAWGGLGLLYAREQHYSEAEEAFERATWFSDYPFASYLRLGQLDLKVHHPEQALRAFSKAEVKNPYWGGRETLAPELFAQVAEGRATAEKQLGRTAEAVQFEEESVRLTPRDKTRWDRLADLYELSGQSERSSQARQRARAIAATSAQ